MADEERSEADIGSATCATALEGYAYLPRAEDRAVDVFDDLSNTEISSLIDEWIRSERDRRVLKRRLLDGVRFEALAEEFDLSVRQVKTIVYKGEERIFSKIQ